MGSFSPDTLRTMVIRPTVRSALTLLCCLLFLDAYAHADAARTPPLWRIDYDGRSMYLLGTVHLMPPRDARLDAHVRSILRASDALILEVDPGLADPASLGNALSRHAFLPDDTSLAEVLPPSTWAQVQHFGLRLGLLPMQIGPFRPWYVAQLLTGFAMAEAGLDPEAGTEAQLHLAAAVNRVPIYGLESIDQQLGIFSDLPMQAEIALLEQSLEDIQNMDSEIERLLYAWSTNDVSYFETLLDELQDDTELYQAVIVERHTLWLPQLLSFLYNEEMRTTLVAVGTLHLYGEDGLLDELYRLGFPSEPVLP